MMNLVIDQVRSSVLHHVTSEPDLFDEVDVESHIRTRDGFIRIFCKHYSELHHGTHDVAAISDRLVETLKWRKSVNLNSMRSEDFPLELWTINPWTVYQDDEYFIVLYTPKNEVRISERWSELKNHMVLHVHNNYTLEAVSAAKSSFYRTRVTPPGP